MSSRDAVERSLLHAQLELHRHDAESLHEAHNWLVRALVQLEELRNPGRDPVRDIIHELVKEGTK